MGENTGTGGAEVPGGKLVIEKYFSASGVYDAVKWGKNDVNICDESGRKLFTQKNVEFPDYFSDLARTIVSSKYFYGEQGTGERESSLKQIVERVSEKISSWGINKRGFDKQEYFSEQEAEVFRDEIAALCLNQFMAFNSPVWFNVGVDKYNKEDRKLEERDSYVINERGEAVKIPLGGEYRYPQSSACFIQSVDDTLEDIMDLAKREAMLFKYGSGTGTDLSTLRSSKEKLSGGGKPSGPLAYEMFYDRVAGIVRSGGKTRRAAKMNSLKDNHPDILEFIEAKAREERKLGALADYLMKVEKMDAQEAFDEAQKTVAFQNANFSVRVSDDFMRAVENDEEWQTVPIHNKEMAEGMPKYKARGLLRKIAEGTWTCGDPGIQFHTTINKGHTCPNSAPINASNPCSEYVFVDNSACNLASLRLTKFLNDNGTFDVDKFDKAVERTIIAQEMLISNSSYPTSKIAKNAHDFRPLGLGYADLGALLMKMGLAYDSDDGRAVAAAITARMTGVAYKTSIEMAKKLGTFNEYEKNKEPMLKVIEKHRDSLKNIDKERLEKRGLENILYGVVEYWDGNVSEGEKYGYRNAQVTVLAPTGTIGFMMDCDTTGIEAETWLAKLKNLAGGGELYIMNSAMKPALERLGYGKEEIESILNFVEKSGTVEGSKLKEEHLSVFDCTYKSPKGKRFIHYSGQLKMMAAVQPFLSGAISKTVGLPNETTVEEIEKVYIDAWKMGLKAVALYRDRSKIRQPLKSVGKLEEEVREPVRRKLPTTRPAINHKFEIAGGHEGYVNIGMYEDGKPGETFMTMAKEGSTISGLMDTIATLASMALQYGVPLKALVRKFRHMNFEPRGEVKVGHPNIHQAVSIIDYIFSYLGEQFPDLVKDEEEEKEKKRNHEIIEQTQQELKKNGNVTETLEEMGGFCIKCEKQMVKKGHCIEMCSNPECLWVNPKGCDGGG